MAREKPTPRRRRRALPKNGGSVYSLSEAETYEMGRTLGRRLTAGELILLEGSLGVGKTVFARGVAAGLGVAPEQVCSPSFTLVHEYTGGRHRLFHTYRYNPHHT